MSSESEDDFLSADEEYCDSESKDKSNIFLDSETQKLKNEIEKWDNTHFKNIYYKSNTTLTNSELRQENLEPKNLSTNQHLNKETKGNLQDTMNDVKDLYNKPANNSIIKGKELLECKLEKSINNVNETQVMLLTQNLSLNESTTHHKNKVKKEKIIFPPIAENLPSLDSKQIQIDLKKDSINKEEIKQVFVGTAIEQKPGLKKPREKLGLYLGTKKLGLRITKPLIGISSDHLQEMKEKSETNSVINKEEIKSNPEMEDKVLIARNTTCVSTFFMLYTYTLILIKRLVKVFILYELQ